MSLVAYDSSEDSERDDPSPEPRRSSKPGGMFSSLPKRSEAAAGKPKPGLELLRAKKRTEPVRISAPEIHADSSDEDEGEPVRKKVGSQGGALSCLLPQPKRLSVKETQRTLMPHTLTKRPAAPTKAAKPASQGMFGMSPSPSAIKAAAKTASLQFTRQMAADEEGSEDELAPENYFSLSESSSEPAAGASSYPNPQPYTPSLQQPNTEDAPLNFGFGPEAQYKPAWGTHEYHTAEYQAQDHKPSPPDYYSEEYYQEQNSGCAEQEEAESSTLFNDEAFRRLQGKQNRGKEEIKFLEIKGDDQLIGRQQWMIKNMTTDTEPRRSFSKKKGDQPTGQQRRKHQITYLIHQAKEREMELKNSWADNKLTKRQTQAKYGF